MDICELERLCDEFLESYEDDYPFNGVTCGQIFKSIFEEFIEFLD